MNTKYLGVLKERLLTYVQAHSVSLEGEVRFPSGEWKPGALQALNRTLDDTREAMVNATASGVAEYANAFALLSELFDSGSPVEVIDVILRQTREDLIDFAQAYGDLTEHLLTPYSDEERQVIEDARSKISAALSVFD